MLYRRLLSLMIATFAAAYVIELGVGHVVADFARPLFEHGAIYATLFGVAVDDKQQPVMYKPVP